MPRGALHASSLGTARPPIQPGDIVVSDYRVPPFYKNETLVVEEIKNVGTRGNPYWRVLLHSQRGVSGWLDASSLVRL